MANQDNQTPSTEAVRAELTRILASPGFADSQRISGFLRYVVEARLAGDEDRIQEYAIGLAVFERPESFDPRTDSIVRVEARRLRDRLARYYETAESESAVRIELPRRGYVPRFLNGSPSDAPARRAAANRTRAMAMAPWLVAAACAVAAVAGWWRRQPVRPPHEPVVFTIPAPAGMRHVPVAIGGGAVLSPSGRKIVFVAGIADGEQYLYVRKLDEPKARRLEGAEGARWPFWSPDSRKIGFGAHGQIKAIDLDTGIVITLAATDDYFGGAWGGAAGSTILWGSRTGTLHLVDVSGGTPAELTSLVAGELGHRWPHFLPDGEDFLFLSARESDPQFEIRLGRLAHARTVAITSAESQAVFTQRDGQGRLLFVRDQTLFAQRFDPGAARLSGPAVPLAEQINSSRGEFGKYEFSAARSGAVSYRQREVNFGWSELAWYDRTGARLGQAAPADSYFFVSLSPDERVVAVTLAGTGVNVDLWTIDLERGVRQRRTRHAAIDRTPVWSPDGETILFNSTRDETKMFAVGRRDGPVRPVEVRGHGVVQGGWPTDWSGPVNRIVFFRGGNLYSMRPGAEAELLLGGDYDTINGRISPDGRWLAFASRESGQWEIWLAPFRDARKRQQVSSGGGNYPLWRDDSQELFYNGPDGALMSVDVKETPNLEISRPKELFQMNLPFSPAPTIYRYAVAKNGQRFLCQNLLDEPDPIVVIEH